MHSSCQFPSRLTSSRPRCPRSRMHTSARDTHLRGPARKHDAAESPHSSRANSSSARRIRVAPTHRLRRLPRCVFHNGANLHIYVAGANVVHAATARGAILRSLSGVGVVEAGAQGGARSPHTLHACAAARQHVPSLHETVSCETLHMHAQHADATGMC